MSVWRELLARAVLASLGLPPLCLLGWLGGWWWYGLVAAITVVILGEYYSACVAKGFRPPALLGYAWALAILYGAAFAPQRAWAWGGPMLFAAVCTITLRALLPPRREYVGSIATGAFGLAYIGVGMAFLLLLRAVDLPAALERPPAWSFTHRMGAVLLVLLPVWASDTGAFLVGRLWGRHKLTPALSPNKTVEGALGGLGSAVAGALVLGALWLRLPWLQALGLGLVLGLACQLGGCVQSALKRDLGLKDFGGIFGPHGGAFDRFDGLLLAMPAGYAYLLLTLPGYARLLGI
jgi:phosphatidate cytidylyltransferase